MERASSAEPDLCVIGAGGAGFEIAMAGAALGLAVVVIEREISDEALRNGDLAQEVFRAAARRVASSSFGSEPVEFERVHAHLLATLQSAAPDRRLARLEAMNIRVIRGAAEFDEARIITADGERLRPRRTVIATGSVGRPGLAGEFESVPRFTPDRLDLLTQRPAHLVVTGSGAAALALGQSYRRLGSAVTVLTEGEPLPGIDREFVEPVVRALRQDGVILRAKQIIALGADIPEQGGAIAYPSHILLAEARRPAVDDLNLKRAGIAAWDGSLELSAALRTSNPRVFAIGDVTGSDSIAAAQAQIGVVLRAAFFRLPVRYRRHLVPQFVSTDPAIATVGLSEAEARRAGPVSIYRWPFAETDLGRASGDTKGHVKIVADRAGRVLGVGIVGADARELIAFWALAISRGATLAQLGNLAGSRVAFGEASRRAVMTHVAGRLANPWLKRALAIVARLG